MSSNELTETAGAPADCLPPPRGLGRLADAVRAAAQKQKLPSEVADRYLDWIFLFVGWCLKAPPHRVSETRLGDFREALSNRGLPRARVCEAMDALALLFGAVGEPKRHLYPDGPPKSSAEQSLGQNDLWRVPNSSAEYLPEGTLPPSADSRAVVPTRDSEQASNPGATQRPVSGDSPQTFWEVAEEASST